MKGIQLLVANIQEWEYLSLFQQFCSFVKFWPRKGRCVSVYFFSRDEFLRFTFSDKKNYIKLLKISFTVPLSKVCVNLLINVEINVKFDLVTVHIHARVIRIMAIKGVLYNYFRNRGQLNVNYQKLVSLNLWFQRLAGSVVD